MILIMDNEQNPELAPVEIVERKGLGHPDTLCDLVADHFSLLYSHFCLAAFGHIANHAVDKVVLLGASSRVSFGVGEVQRPIRACLFGKAVRRVGVKEIPIEEIFEEAVQNVLGTVFGPGILDFVVFDYLIHDGIGADHLPGFYRPRGIEDLVSAGEDVRGNDTAYCSAFAPGTPTERLSMRLENYVCSDEFKRAFPQTGWDVKVMALRRGRRIEIVSCVPFLAQGTPSLSEYRNGVEAVTQTLEEFAQPLAAESGLEAEITVNTRDRAGNFAYLTVFGTALDKGDQGVVGRGNRFSGTISAARKASVEAPFGKNPVRHTGKLYSCCAEEISWALFQSSGEQIEVCVVGRNGDPIEAPALISIYGGVDPSFAVDVAAKSAESVRKWTHHYIQIDPVQRHRSQGDGMPEYLPIK